MAILTRGIKLSEFASMSEEETESRVDELFQAANNPSTEQFEQQKSELEQEILFFESQYNMASEEMKQRLAMGEISESADICSWLMLLKIRGQLKDGWKSPRGKSF
jgi:hypothetical protein